MDYINRYRKRLYRNGEDTGEALTNNTISFINRNFTSSPTYRKMEVSSSSNPTLVSMDARVVEIERLGTLREIILRPNESLEIGTYVRFDGYTWLLFDKYGGAGSTSIKMLAIKCNRKIKWVPRGDNSIVCEYDCVASATDLGSKAKQSKNEIEWNKYDVRLPLGQLFISIEANTYTRKIKLNDRFIFGRNVYEVTGIDDVTNIANNGEGIIQLTVKITTQRTTDDFENGLAENIYKDEEINSTEPTSPIIDDGGMLW